MFDMDGTLIDSQDVIYEAMRRAFATMGLAALPKAKVLSIVGLSLDEAISTLMPELSKREVAEGVALYKQSFIALRAEQGGEAAAPLYQGVKEALDALSSDAFLVMGVATGKARRGLDHAYKSHDIGHYFMTHQTADTHPSKPHPSMLLTALQETGVDVTHAVMIGDTRFDMDMAKAAGYHAIGVDWGYHPVEALASADHILNSMGALPDYLNSHWETRR